MKAKYIRVSTTDQNTARQENTSNEVKIFIDKISGTVPFSQRPQGAKLLKEIEQGKVTEVTVHSLDRLGRNQLDILLTIETFKAHKCQLTIENLGISLLTPTKKESSAFNLIISVMSSMAEMEREQMIERQTEGIAIAKAQGKYKGRKIGSLEDYKKIIKKHQDIVKCYNAKMSVRDIANVTDKSTSTVQKVIKILKGL